MAVQFCPGAPWFDAPKIADAIFGLLTMVVSKAVVLFLAAPNHQEE